MNFIKKNLVMFFIGSVCMECISCKRFEFAIHPFADMPMKVEMLNASKVSISKPDLVSAVLSNATMPDIPKEIVYSERKKSEIFHDLAQKCMHEIDALIRDQVIQGIRALDFVCDESEHFSTMNFADLFRCLNSFQLSAVHSEQKDKLLEACMEFNRDKIADVLVEIYISIVSEEEYTTNMLVKKENMVFTTVPFLQVQKKSLVDFIFSMLETDCLDEEDTPIKRAVALFKGEIKGEKGGKSIFEGVFSHSDSIHEEIEEAEGSGLIKVPFVHPQIRYLFKEKSQYRGCPFFAWCNSIKSGAYNNKSVEIPWAYLDARIYANTRLEFDLLVLETIANSITNLVEIKDRKEVLVIGIESLSRVIRVLVKYIQHSVSIYLSKVEKENSECVHWCKARILSIVQSYLKGELTAVILYNELEMILGDVLYNLMKEKVLTNIKNVTEILVLDEYNKIDNWAKIGILGNDISYLSCNWDVNPYPVPSLIMNLFADRKISEKERVCIFAA